MKEHKGHSITISVLSAILFIFFSNRQAAQFFNSFFTAFAFLNLLPVIIDMYDISGSNKIPYLIC